MFFVSSRVLVPKRVMSGELKNAGKRGPGGERRKSGRTGWQRIFDYLASRGTGAPPHLTLGPGIWSSHRAEYGSTR